MTHALKKVFFRLWAYKEFENRGIFFFEKYIIQYIDYT
jgi:hypothetical protein